ncbi:(2Fe-2S)-binding protein [Catellatospora sp. TT07R-123]|uniref:aromatic ring-hydroxylating oxygenase subunit alpha n=1 Tax=Catellatospora sp. TT07R-123 TaxID=2733863 RepID=UPI001B090B5D|nr:aromatic ring-hydroxylating dioxygenase subunit alpha [Catellatospora sp. TT07R-123]GHJ49075.1 (2Fe-2S)-binding protein [Catellatospora sp. TT07R-123]
MSPAPLAADGLAAALRPFGQSRMLPVAAYTDERVLAWERRHLFAGSWTCLGRTAQLAADGNQHQVTVGDVSVVVTVGEQVRAFANACRHRGHELLGAGQRCERRALVCPYHGWSYDLDGALRTAPRMGDDFEARAFGLVELPAVDWHGWVFVNAGAAAMPFEQHLGTLDDLVAPYAAEHLTVKAVHRYEVGANWKIIAENYHECYHCPLIHPELCAVTPPTSGDNWHEPGNWLGGSMQLREHAETMSLDGRSRGVMLPGVDPREVRYLGLFPNLLLSLHPDYVMAHRMVPLAADRTFVECSWLFDDKVADPAYAVDFWDVTNRQDWAACESVQRGMSSPHYTPGPLAPNETAIYDWVTMLARAYRDPAGVLGPQLVENRT